MFQVRTNKDLGALLQTAVAEQRGIAEMQAVRRRGSAERAVRSQSRCIRREGEEQTLLWVRRTMRVGALLEKSVDVEGRTTKVQAVLREDAPDGRG